MSRFLFLCFLWYFNNIYRRALYAYSISNFRNKTMESGPWSSEAGRWRDRGHWSHHLPAPSLASRYLCLDRGHGSHHLPAPSLASRYLCLDRDYWSHHLPTFSAASRYLCLDPDTNPELFSLGVQICIRIQASLAIGPGIFLTGRIKFSLGWIQIQVTTTHWEESILNTSFPRKFKWSHLPLNLTFL